MTKFKDPWCSVGVGEQFHVDDDVYREFIERKLGIATHR